MKDRYVMEATVDTFSNNSVCFDLNHELFETLQVNCNKEGIAYDNNNNILSNFG